MDKVIHSLFVLLAQPWNPSLKISVQGLLCLLFCCCADFKNVSIVGHYIKERTKNAQFVIISLRNNMFELADRLVGIYKTDNTTKSVAINPGGRAGVPVH